MIYLREEAKTKYSFFENSKYMLNILKVSNKTAKGKIYLHIFYKVFPRVLRPLVATFILKVLVDCTGGEMRNEELVFSVLFFVIANIVFDLMEKWNDMHYIYNNYLRYYFDTKMLNKSLSDDYENLESYGKRKLLERAKRFTSGGERGAAAIITHVQSVLITLTGVGAVFAIVALADPLIVLISFITSILCFFIGICITKNFIPMAKKLSEVYTKVNYLSNGSAADMKSAKDMRVFDMVSWFSPLFDLIIGDEMRVIKAFSKKQIGLSVLSLFLMLLRDVLIFVCLIHLYNKGELTAGNFAFYYSVIRAANSWIMSICEEFDKIYRCHTDCDNFRIYLDLENEPANETADEIPEKCDIEFKNVSFSYNGKTPVIKNLSLKVNSGEKIAVVGENGAGKTTMMKLLLGFYNPSAGEILINGRDMRRVKKDDRYKFFSAVFQDSFSIPASIAKNITLEDNYNEEKLQKIIELSGLREKIDSLPEGVNTKLHKDLIEDAAELSGGEMQKLSLARAVYKEAPIIVLDEPTAALDPIAENEIYVKYSEITKNRTSFYISHRLASTAFCDRVIFLKDGRIAETGTHRELMEKKGEYFKMYSAQSYYYKEKISAGEVL